MDQLITEVFSIQLSIGYTVDFRIWPKAVTRTTAVSRKKMPGTICQRKRCAPLNPCISALTICKRKRCPPLNPCISALRTTVPYISATVHGADDPVDLLYERSPSRSRSASRTRRLRTTRGTSPPSTTEHRRPSGAARLPPPAAPGNRPAGFGVSRTRGGAAAACGSRLLPFRRPAPVCSLQSAVADCDSRTRVACAGGLTALTRDFEARLSLRG